MNSGIFSLHYAKVNFSDVGGGQLPILEEYRDVAIYGFTDFAATDRARYLTFAVNLGPFLNYTDGTQNDYGITMPPAVPVGSPAILPI